MAVCYTYPYLLIHTYTYPPFPTLLFHTERSITCDWPIGGSWLDWIDLLTRSHLPVSLWPSYYYYYYYYSCPTYAHCIAQPRLPLVEFRVIDANDRLMSTSNILLATCSSSVLNYDFHYFIFIIFFLFHRPVVNFVPFCYTYMHSLAVFCLSMILPTHANISLD